MCCQRPTRTCPSRASCPAGTRLRIWSVWGVCPCSRLLCPASYRPRSLLRIEIRCARCICLGRKVCHICILLNKYLHLQTYLFQIHASNSLTSPLHKCLHFSKCKFLSHEPSRISSLRYKSHLHFPSTLQTRASNPYAIHLRNTRHSPMCKVLFHVLFL